MISEGNAIKVGDTIPVEIAGESIGDAVVSEITDTWVEVVFYGFAKRLSIDVLDYLNLKEQIDGWGL